MSTVRHLRALQAFDAVATCGSVSEAANRLGVTHGAVSRQLRLLEDYLGTRLFERRAGGMTRTPAGDRLHASTSEAFRMLEAGIENTRGISSNNSITISLSTSLALKWFVPRLPRLRALLPDLAILLDTNDSLVAFEDRHIDLAIRFGTPPWRGSWAGRLSAEELVVVASPALVGDARPPLAPVDVIRFPLLSDRFNAGWDEWAGAVSLEPASLPAPGLEFADSAVLIEAALDAHGVALARHTLVYDDLLSGRLLRLEPTTVPLARGLYFVCREAEQHRPAHRTIREWLVAELPLSGQRTSMEAHGQTP